MRSLRPLARPLLRVLDSRLAQRAGAFSFLAGLVWGFLKLGFSDFPTAPLILTAFGAGLLGATIVVPLLRRAGLVAEPPAAPALPAPTAPTPDPSPAPATLNRWEIESLRVRAAREVREELLDNRGVLERVEDPTDYILGLRADVWVANKDTLVELPDPAPYADTSEAYRRVTTLGPATEPALAAAIEAIDQAVATLDRVRTEE